MAKIDIMKLKKKLAVDERICSLGKEIRLQEETLVNAKNEVLEVLLKHGMLKETENGIDANIDLSQVIGHIINSVREESDDLPSFYIERSFDYVVAKKMMKFYKPMLLEIYDLVQKKIEGDRFNHNDGDNNVIIIEQKDPEKKVMTFRDQNTYVLVVIDRREIHVRQLWDEENEDEYYAWDMASDYVKGNHWIRRPSLAWYAKKEFQLDYSHIVNGKLEKNKDFNYRTYGDCRDYGYILSLEERVFGDVVEQTIGSYHKVRSFFMNVSCAHYCIVNDDY